ncbi:MAG TPA: aminotransferase class I/II-fold pyridoxal phosphate-dependent enzyme [Ktedonobacteraceae bacterium]
MEHHISRRAITAGQQFEDRAPLALTGTLREMASSPTLAINEAVARRQAAGKQTLHLGFGEAMFPLHPALRAALTAATDSTGYAPVAGVPKLRQAIAGYIERTRGVSCGAEQVVVGPGSKPLIYALFHVLAGDVLLPQPSWVSYGPQARLAGRQVIPVATAARDHHRLTSQALNKAVRAARAQGAAPRVLVVNSPSNPTGSMFAPEDVATLGAWARAQGMTIISDEIYAELAHGWRPHLSLARVYPEGSIITGGLSKAFSAGGWRLGYAILPPGERGSSLGKALRALASEIWSSAATPIAEAASAAFTPNAELDMYVQRSARIHGYITHSLYQTLSELGMSCPAPAGGFYLYPDFALWRAPLATLGVTTSSQLASYLLDSWAIATLPAVAFGEEPEALRLRLATSMLCCDSANLTPAQQTAQLWQLLAQADSLPVPGTTGQPVELDLPALTQAQQRWREVIEHLNSLA